MKLIQSRAGPHAASGLPVAVLVGGFGKAVPLRAARLLRPLPSAPSLRALTGPSRDTFASAAWACRHSSARNLLTWARADGRGW